MLTYTIRFKKFEVKPNITVDYYSIDRYKDVQYINGKITINSKELINKVCKKKNHYKVLSKLIKSFMLCRTILFILNILSNNENYLKGIVIIIF